MKLAIPRDQGHVSSMTGLEALVLSSVAGIVLARWKERSGWRWGIVCLFCPPALLVLLFLPDLDRQPAH